MKTAFTFMKLQVPSLLSREIVRCSKQFLSLLTERQVQLLHKVNGEVSLPVLGLAVYPVGVDGFSDEEHVPRGQTDLPWHVGVEVVDGSHIVTNITLLVRAHLQHSKLTFSIKY